MKKLTILMCLCLFAISTYAQNKPTDRELFDKAYVMKPEDIKLVNMAYIPGGKTILYKIERSRKETKVTFLQPLYFDSQWIHYSKGYTIVNKKNGDEYLVRGYDGNLPMGRVIIVRGCNKKLIYITLVFPRLKNNAKYIDIIEKAVEDDPCPSNNNGIPTSYKNVKVKAYSPKAIKKQENRKVKMNVYR